MITKDTEKQAESLSCNDGISYAIDQGLKFLKEHQLPNGEFCVYYAPDDHMEEWNVPDSSVFPTAVIATTLLHLQERTEVQQLYQKLIPFLIYQRMRYGIWGYFTNWHKLFPLLPPDIDDTIFAYYFLKSQDIESPDPTSLILANCNRKGLLYTWFTFRLRKNRNKQYWRTVMRELKHPIKSMLFWNFHDCKRNDIDIGVNMNVLSYLGETEKTKPIVEYVRNYIIKDDVVHNDGWYQNPIILYYLFSRNAGHKIASFIDIYPDIIEKTRSFINKDGSIGSTHLDTALALSTLINLDYSGPEIEQGVSYLLKSQSSSGEWKRSIFSYSGPKRVVGWGSEELTSAFCLEALTLFRNYNSYAGKD